MTTTTTTAAAAAAAASAAASAAAPASHITLGVSSQAFSFGLPTPRRDNALTPGLVRHRRGNVQIPPSRPRWPPRPDARWPPLPIPGPGEPRRRVRFSSDHAENAADKPFFTNLARAAEGNAYNNNNNNSNAASSRAYAVASSPSTLSVSSSSSSPSLSDLLNPSRSPPLLHERPLPPPHLPPNPLSHLLPHPLSHLLPSKPLALIFPLVFFLAASSAPLVPWRPAPLTGPLDTLLSPVSGLASLLGALGLYVLVATSAARLCRGAVRWALAGAAELGTAVGAGARKAWPWALAACGAWAAAAALAQRDWAAVARGTAGWVLLWAAERAYFVGDCLRDLAPREAVWG
ncbi:hypothetical protein VTJ83DRAFT_4432 [Remersonia thermophila]|uniref:Uncharacterized protein n=1 Tax=Remersonia thermophila TaxID=72144 RepID=A0ABR4DA03_9PEZI